MQRCAFCVFTGIPNPRQPKTRINFKKISQPQAGLGRIMQTIKHPKLTLKTKYFIIHIPIYNSIKYSG